MTESEHCAKSAKSTGAVLVVAIAIFNFNDPVVVRVANKAREPVCRNFVLEVDVRNWGTDVVGVEASLGGDVLKANGHVVVNMFYWLGCVVVVGLTLGVSFENSPIVVAVFVRVEGDLLLIAASGVIVLMRVEVATLSVDMAKGNLRAKSNI